MRVSRLMLVTLRDAPADAEVISHQLLLRGGFIKRVTSGIYAYMPLLLKVIKKITSIVQEELDAKGVSFQILDMNLDTSTPTGKLMLTLLGGVYQFEREILLERQKIGIEKAQREGKFKGRVPTAKRKTDEIKTLIAEGLKPHQIAAQLNIGDASVYRYR